MQINDSFKPLVSCIMPTFNRREFVPRALDYFLRQDYPNTELIILDDGEDCVVDLIPNDFRVHYYRESNRKNVGAKRNWLCEQAQGEIIIHWDDDDWFASNRINLQVEAICREAADICGLNRVYFLSSDTRSAWEYVYSVNSARWVCGSSLCYTKEFWQRNRFAEINVGEDSRFVWANRTARIAVMPENKFLVALVHDANTSRKRVRDRAWNIRNPEHIRDLMGNDWAFYSGEKNEHRDCEDDRQTKTSHSLPTVTPVQESSKVSIGIHITDDGDRLLATCAAIAANTKIQVEVLLLADGVDASAESTITQLSKFRSIGFSSRRGAPSCFNLLAREGSGDILIFLESGALPGPGWLELLCLALSQNSSYGLAGPSTNRSWNMQCVFPKASAKNVTNTVKMAQSRFAGAVRTMEPLYCLADFCFAVRREVVETIGAADEAYGEGPCWEMDYSLRAVRAGWQPVWAQSAYVYRMPPTPQRTRQEAKYFRASKHRYQDKFCARQLGGNKGRYNTHCRGEQCRNFAPQEQIAISIPLNEKKHQQSEPTCILPESSLPAELSASRSMRPLVSCIMPTYNRRSFIHLALQCFDAQDYEPKELIVVDDGDDSIEDLVCDHPHVRYKRLNGWRSIGEKRNIACQLARGKIVVLWDDDDWYGNRRITAQVNPILSNDAQITGLDARWFLDLNTREFWTLSAALHQRLFAGNIAGGTLAFERSIWESGVRFPIANLAEDAHFLLRAQKKGAHLLNVSNDNLFIYMRHGNNSWKFKTGNFLESQSWLRINPPNGFNSALAELYEQAAVQKINA